jgi:Fe-S oxidoreductase
MQPHGSAACGYQLDSPLAESGLAAQLQLVSADCTSCGICVRECTFLTDYGDPKSIADRYNPEQGYASRLAFECSLCGLCTAVCPQAVNPTRMFLEMRREAFAREEAELAVYRGLRRYEKTGTSQRYSWYALPQHCDTIFFPGCALTGSRPKITLQTYQLLQKSIPALGIVLDCCTKPSHDLGDSGYFNAMFGEMKNYLLKQGIKNILVACPNCLEVFSDHGREFSTRTVYEVLDEVELPVLAKSSATVSIHDPCVSRYRLAAQQAVRRLLTRQGLTIAEPRHTQQRTICCGDGGGVSCLIPQRAQKWARQRISEVGDNRIVSYCASCTHRFASAQTASSHVLDLVFAPEKALQNQLAGAKAPLTYFNRLKLKRHLRHHFVAAVTRERTFQADRPHGKTLLQRLLGPRLSSILMGSPQRRGRGVKLAVDHRQLKGQNES